MRTLGGLATRRLGAHPAAVAAVVATAVLAVLVLATLQAFTSSLSRGGVTGTVTRAEPVDRSIVVSGGIHTEGLAAMDAAVRAAVAAADRPVGVDLATRSVSWTLPGGTPESPDLARLAHLSGIADHAELTGGAWPEDAAPAEGSPIEVAVPEAVAEQLGWAPGRQVRLASRLPTGPPELTVTVTGVYRPTDPTDPFWLGDAFANTGVGREQFTTYGPLVTTAATFADHLTRSANATWRLYPRLTGLDAASLPAARAAVAALLADLTARPALADTEVTSPLPDLLAGAYATQLRTRSALLTPALLLGLLSATAVLLAGSLLGSLRDAEDRLLLARGADRRHLLALAATEAAAVVAPAAVVAGLAAPPLATALAGTGTAPAGTWLTAAATAAAAGVLLVATAARTAPAAPGSRRAARPRLALVRRSGLDLVLVVLGVVGYTQLRRYAGTAGAETLAGRVDPFVVAAPALVLLAVSVVSLRLLPVLTRLGRRLASRSRGLATAWGGWQVDRHLSRQSGLVLLLVLAVAMGSLALVHRATAAQATADQATYRVGADLRVDLPMAPAAASLTVERLLAAAVGGDERVLPVLREQVTVGPLDAVDLRAVDADRAPDVVQVRPDQLRGRDLAGLLDPLVAARPDPAVLDLPGEPATLEVDVAATEPAPGARLAVVLQDGSGLWHRLAADLPTTPGPHTVTFDLTGGPDGAPTYPLAVAGIDATLPGPPPPDLVGEVRTAEAGAAPVAVPGSGEWAWSGGDGRAVGVRATTAATPLPVLVTPGVLAAAGAELGEEVRLPWQGTSLTVVPTAVVQGLPTLDQPHEGIVADLRSVVALGLDPDEVGTAAAALAAPDRVTQWWLDLPDGADAGAVAEALRAALPPGTVVADRAAVAAELAADPLAAGMRQALLLVTGAALLLATIGFAVTTVVLMNRQRGELAVLYALGAPPRSVRRALLVERAALVTGTTVLGLVLGTVAAAAIVPSTVISTDVAAPVPPVQVAPPWPTLAGFGAAVVVLLLLVALGLVRRLRPRRVAATLRAGGTT